MSSDKPAALDHSALYQHCDARAFDFATTNDLAEIDLAFSQQRALGALSFGTGIKGAEYNIFALGLPGAGKLHTIREVLQRKAGEQPPAGDWCYVNNFEQPHKPRVLRLPPQRGSRLRLDVDQLMEELEATIPAAFESEDYRTRIEELNQEFESHREQVLEELRVGAEQQGIVLVRTPGGFAFAPKGGRNEVLSPDEFNELPAEEKKKIQEKVETLQARLQRVLRQFPAWRKEVREKVKNLDREIAEYAVGHPIEVLAANYADLPEVTSFLDAMRRNIIANVDDFRAQPETAMPLFGPTSRPADLRRYRVNLLVDNGGQESAPVVYEDLPNHGNLIGRCEHQALMGTLVTDFTMIKPGALHRANGGYLILEARKILLQPYAWETLKRALESREVRIESLERVFGWVTTTTLEPEPIPLEVKVVLVGDRLTYYLLRQFDPEFPKLFKVAADFEDVIDRNGDSHLSFARMLGTLARQNGLRAVDRDGVARIIEHCSRLVEDAEKLSTHLGRISDLLREADYWAAQAGHEHVAAADVQRALDEQLFRADRIRRRVLENIARGTIMIDTDGTVVGQVNGLSVINLGDFSFGQPSRITATTRLGEGEFVDIEREAELGGAIHSKGVLILSSFLAARYARGIPLSVRASVVFEQSYGEVEGDSASLAELCAILSSLADVPIRQCLAVTGSVNQHGRVQPIGGVNEKIEGFFDVCKTTGLKTGHGVVIPLRNVNHLMLREDVIAAVKEGRFGIYAVDSVDETLELLTGLSAGASGDDGRFPDDTVNGRVDTRLREYASIRRRFSRSAEHDKAGESGDGD
ncbi:MAG: AAA family ATPase [Gammaproteobacteria bacterium]|nr:AAA family ATPase [Gammaproteobacteria bacterium]